jgi:V/A-type H+-transporting ATPase subunit C
MKGRLLGREGALGLLALPDLAARLDFLRKTDYGEAIATHLPSVPDPLEGAERGLRARLMSDLRRIDGFLRDERAQALFRAILAFEDGENLKTILRGLARGEAPERVFPLLAPTPGLDDPALRELVRERDVKSVIDRLATWQSPYALPLEEALPFYLRKGELLFLENALDRFLFARGLARARRDGEDGRILLGFLRTRVDLTNARTLLKLAGEGVGSEFFIPGGLTITESVFLEYAALGQPGLAGALVREFRHRFGEGWATLEEIEDPFTAEQRFHAALAAMLSRQARLHPLSLAVPLAFVLERQAEVRRIRLAIRGAEFGLAPAELQDLMAR